MSEPSTAPGPAAGAGAGSAPGGPAGPPVGRPGRYQRSFSGLLGAMIILVVVVLAVVGWRALFRAELEVEPEAVDYREAGEAVAASGVPVVLPTALPEGWIATSAELDRGRAPVWRLGVLTDDERFVGLRQGPQSAEELLEETYPEVDDLRPVEPVEVEGAAVATDWEAWEVEDDLAWATEVGDTVVLVHGSAPPEDLAAFARSLEELPVGEPAR